jgi:hypothetical protein
MSKSAFVFALLAGAAIVTGAHGQARPDTMAEGTQLPGTPAALPDAFEVVTRYRSMDDSAAEAERAIARLAASGAIETELGEAGRRHAELRSLLASLTETDYVRPERLSRVRDQALLEEQRLDGLRDRTFARLEQLRGHWLQRQRFWREWRDALRPTADFGTVASDMADAIARIDAILGQTAAATSSLLGLQRGIEELRAGSEQIAGEVTALPAGGRAAPLQRTEPLLLSAGHRAQLRAVERRLAEAGIEIPFPQRDLHVRSVDTTAATTLLGRGS